MKKLIMLMTLIVGSWFIYPTAQQEVTKVYGEIYNQIAHNKFKGQLPLHKAVKLHTKAGFCSGFKTTSGIIVTAKHCLEVKTQIGLLKVNTSIEPVYAVDAGQEKNLTFDTYTVAKFGDKDLVLLFKTDNVEENNKLLLQLMMSGELRLTPVKKGEQLFILGTNGDELISDMVIRPITITRIMFVFTQAIWGLAYNIEGGTSGSGVVDKDGKLVGVLSVGKNGSPEAGITTILK